MNENVKSTFEHMLGGRSVSEKLEKMYDEVKLMNDRVSGGILSEGILAVMAHLCDEPSCENKPGADWASVSEGTKVRCMVKDEIKDATFVKAYDSVAHKNRLLVHLGTDSSNKNTMVDKATVKLV